MEECFVCFDTRPPVHRVCRCNTRIHTECFSRLTQVPAHSTHCPVCQQQYRLLQTMRLQCNWGTTGVTAAALGALGMLAWTQHWVLTEASSSGLVNIVHLTGASAMLVVGCAWRSFVRESGCCVSWVPGRATLPAGLV